MKTKLLIFNILVTLQLVIGRKFKIRRTSRTETEGWPTFNAGKYVTVFGVKVIAQSTVCNRNLQYAANVLAQMLDGNEDGLPDDKRVIAQLQKHKYALMIFSTKALNSSVLEKISHRFQILVASQCSRHTNQKATVLAISRLIAALGLSPAYPRTFGSKKPSILHESLHHIVGNCGFAYDKTLRWPDCTGHVSFNDSSCNAQCMAEEYLVQLMTTSLGVIPSKNETGNRFWDIKSKDDLIKKDPQGYILMKLLQHKLQIKAPDGNYRPGRNGYRMARIPFRLWQVDKAKGKVIEVKI